MRELVVNTNLVNVINLVNLINLINLTNQDNALIRLEEDCKILKVLLICLNNPNQIIKMIVETGSFRQRNINIEWIIISASTVAILVIESKTTLINFTPTE